MIFLKDHLVGVYDWKGEANPSLFDGKATRRMFNRTDGNQVLFVINLFLLEISDPSVEKGRKAEWLLIEKLPFGLKSEVSVFQWLVAQDLDTVIDHQQA